MRTGFLLGYKPGTKSPAILADVTVPYPKQRQMFKKMCAEGGGGFAALERWDSSVGRLHVKRFRAEPTPAPEPQDEAKTKRGRGKE